VHYFGIGNETWGCGGNMRPEYYADLFRQYATYIKAPRGKRPTIVASGGHGESTRWAEVLTTQVEQDLDAISHHYYTLPTGNWEKKGNSLGFTELEWITTLQRTLRVDQFIADNVKVLDKNDPKGKVAFYVDEWGTWYDPEPGREPGFLYQQNSLRDALVAALNFHVFHAHARRVQMANIAQMVNVLQAMILTDGPRMALTPTYHAFQMYVPFQGATTLPVEMKAPAYALDSVSVPAISVSAARDTAGKLQLGLVNLDARREAEVTVDVAGVQAKGATGKVLTARAMDAHNTFDAPDSVRPAPIKARRVGGKLVLRLPPKSVAVVTVE
jgi:alpha-N-arabinofuranosidase